MNQTDHVEFPDFCFQHKLPLRLSWLFVFFNNETRSRNVAGRTSAWISSWPGAKLWQDMTPHILPSTQWRGGGGEAHFHVHHLLLLPLPLWRPPLPPSRISGVKVKSRCVVRAKLIMAAGHRLIPIALLSAPATPVLGGTKGSTDRWDGALWDRVLSWHKKPTK